MSKTIRSRIGKWAILSKATGYSSEYCKSVVMGRRSRTSKGGKLIMKKYEELNNWLGSLEFTVQEKNQ